MPSPSSTVGARPTSDARADAHEWLSGADRAAPLGPEDLELLARTAYMLGRDDDYVGALERAHRAYLDAGQALRRTRLTWWIGHSLLFRGRTGPAMGWFARGERLLARRRGTASSGATC